MPRPRPSIRRRAVAALAAGAIGAALVAGGGASSQPAATTRTDLLRNDLGIPGREAIQTRVGFGPGVAAPRHSHPGEEIAYVLSGTLEYRLGDQPPVTLNAGDALFIPARTIHSARNVGSGNAVELATYVVEKDQPLLILAP